jgi:hypothetical protein
MGLTVPVKDAEFIAFALNLLGECNTHVNDWSLSHDHVRELNTLTGAANHACLVNASPETSSRQTAAYKRFARCP